MPPVGARVRQERCQRVGDAQLELAKPLRIEERELETGRAELVDERLLCALVAVVSLREVTDENREAILALRVPPEQQRSVGTVAWALMDAEEIPEGKPWYRAIYADDQPVGFVMLSWNVTPEPPRIIGPWFLWKLLIDERHQRRGYGRETVMRVADIVRANGAAELLTSFVPGDGGPEPFYRRLGFRPTGELDDNGEVIIALDLRPQDQSSSR